MVARHSVHILCAIEEEDEEDDEQAEDEDTIEEEDEDDDELDDKEGAIEEEDEGGDEQVEDEDAIEEEDEEDDAQFEGSRECVVAADKYSDGVSQGACRHIRNQEGPEKPPVANGTREKSHLEVSGLEVDPQFPAACQPKNQEGP